MDSSARDRERQEARASEFVEASSMTSVGQRRDCHFRDILGKPQSKNGYRPTTAFSAADGPKKGLAG